MDFDPNAQIEYTTDPGGNIPLHSDQDTTTSYEDQGGNVPLYTSPEIMPRPKDLIANRAARAHYALGNKSPGLDALSDSFSTDEAENNFRATLAGEEVAQLDQKKKQLVEEAAQRTGGNINTEQAQLLRHILALTIHPDPNTILERQFATKYTGDVLTANASPSAPTSEATPAQFNLAADEIHNTAAMMEIGRKGLEDVEKAKKDQGWIGWGVDILEGFVPGLSEYRLAHPEEAGIPGSSFNIRERLNYIWQLPIPKAQEEYRKDLDYLLSHNLNDAELYARAFFGMGWESRFARDAGSLVNATPMAVALGAKMTGVVRGAVEGLSTQPIKVKTVYAATGDLAKAAEAGALQKAKTLFTIRDPLLHGTDLGEDVPLIFNPSSVVRLNPGELAREAQDRLVSALEQSARKSAEFAFNLRRIDRVPPETVQVMLQQAKRDFNVEYSRLTDGIINADLVPAETNAGNVNFLKVTIGKRDGTLFKSGTEANNYAQREYGLNVERYTTGGKAPPKKQIIPGAPPKQPPIVEFRKQEGKIFEHLQAPAEGYTRLWRAERSGEPGTRYTTDLAGIALPFQKQYKGPVSYVDVLTKDLGKYLDKVGAAKGAEFTLPADIVKGAKQFNPDAMVGHNGGPPLEADINTVPPVTVKQQGNGFYIQITKPLDEVNPMARESIAIPTHNQNSESIPNLFLGALRGARETLSETQNANRAVTTLVPNQARRLIKEMVKPIGVLRKGSYNRLMNMLEHDLAYTDYPTGTHGRRFYSQGALEREWRQINGALPTEQESLAYWTYHQVMETDLAVRDVNMYRDLSRMGTEHWMMPMRDEKGNETMSQPFFGIFRRDLPWKEKKDWGVWVEDGENSKYYSKSMGDAVKSHIQKIIEEGGQVIQIPNYTDRPLRDITGDGRLINFVVSKNLQSKPLPMRLVDKNDGIHVIYPHPFKVVKPKIQKADKGNLDYFGDQTIQLAVREKDAKAVAQNYEQVNKMIHNGVPEPEIVRFIEGHITGVDPAKLIKEFGKGGRLYSDEYVPITHTRMNVAAIDNNPRLFKQFRDIEDHTKSPLNLWNQVDTSFLQERDLPAREGRIMKSGDFPIVRVQPATTINPMAALQKGLTNAMRGIHMNDMKASSIEQWISQNADLLQDPDLARRNPYYAFYNMAFNKGAPRDQIMNAYWTQNRIRQFIGQSTELGKTQRWVEEKLFNMVPHGTAKWFAVHDYPIVRDPVSYARSAMFHNIFGLFNPKQFFVQVQASAHVGFLAGYKNGMGGMTYSALQRAGLQFTEDPNIFAHYAKIAARTNKSLGMSGGDNPEWFIEAYRFLQRHAGDVVSSEYALRSDLADAKVVTTKVRKFLDWGLFPFTEGERFPKMSAFNAAYLEWRSVNPAAILDRAAEDKILNRAMTFYANMTRAGNSAIEESLASPMLQFTTWNRRLIDQMWGHELTGKEKARAIIGHSILYGIPMGVGTAIPLAVYDDVRSAMLEEGKDMDSTTIRLLTNGLLNYITSLITGRDYDVSRSLGPSNTQIIEDFIWGDKKMLELLSGPLGSFIASAWKAAFPFMANMYLGATGQDGFQLNKEDILDVARQTTIGSSLWRDYYMLNFQKFYSRNEKLISADADWKDALMLTFFGAERQEWRDMQIWSRHLTDVNAAHKDAQKKAIVELQRSYRAMANDDAALSEKHYANALVWMNVFGDLRDDEIVDTFRQSREGLIMGQYDQAKINYGKRGNKSTLGARMQRMFNMK